MQTFEASNTYVPPWFMSCLQTEPIEMKFEFSKECDVHRAYPYDTEVHVSEATIPGRELVPVKAQYVHTWLHLFACTTFVKSLYVA